MAGEKLTGLDQSTLLAERMLGNAKILCGLIAGGANKDVILQQVVSELEDDPVGQACFLRTLFLNIAREGELEVTNRRDAALAILTDGADEDARLTQAMTPLVEANPTVVHDAYIEAVQQQTGKNDPISGSVSALLAVGKAIAPHLSQDTQKRQQVIDAWERTADQFPTVNERLYIRSEIETIKAASSPTINLDSNVEQLRGQGLSNAQIAEQLGRKRKDIDKSAQRLIAAGRIEAAPKGRSVSQATINLDSNVEQLRGQGLSNAQIAEQLGRKRKDIENSAHRLIAAGRIASKRERKPKNLNRRRDK